MMNEDFYILHLSDLHIRNEQKDHAAKEFYSAALSRLLSDIEEQIQNKNNIVIVISGDIIDQGMYDQHQVAALKFFSDLHDKIGAKVCDIIIVPGNHDKCRSRINALISMSHSREGLDSGLPDAEIEWETQLASYERFLSLTNSIYKIFNKGKEETNTFGISTVEINGTKICFVSIDSAWCSHSKDDRRKLRIGKYQLHKLSHEYKAIRNESNNAGKPIGMTIAVSHYPLNWLTAEDEELCNNYFLSDDYLNVDVLMCGHVHDFSIINSFNHKHSLLTLVTGIGWGSKEPDDGAEIHRYSLYTINLFNNSCDIIMRKTKSNGKFDYDYSVYVGEYEFNDGKLRYPLRMREGNPFIRINAPVPFEAQSLFLDSSLLDFIPKVVRAMTSFSNSTARLYTFYQNNFLQELEDNLSLIELSDEEQTQQFFTNVYGKIYDSFYTESELSSELKDQYFDVDNTLPDFLGFLNEICMEAVESLKECFSPGTVLRAHFRWHSFSKSKGKVLCDEYQMLSQYSNLPDDQKSNSMQVVKWGGLIEHAFITGEPIVYSANKRYNPIQTSWDDFITMIPRFSDYSHDVRLSRGVLTSRPVMTFGLSVKKILSRDDAIALYLLAYLRFDEILTHVIDEYIRMFNIDVKKFLPHIEKIKNTYT